MIERFEVGKRYRWTRSEPGGSHRASWIPEIREGLMGGRVALCTRCNEPGTYTQRVAFDIVSGGLWSYVISDNKYFEEVVEEYL